MNQHPEAGLDPRPGRLRLALAARAEAESLRARRAEWLARIRAGAEAAAPAQGGEPALPAREVDDPAPPARDVEALERFLADLVGTIDVDPTPPQPARVSPTRLAPVVPLARPEGGVPLARLESGVPLGRRAGGDPADLGRLPGAGPGLIGALIRGGVPDLAALAGLGREALGAKLGPLGRLIDLDAWLAFARAATGCGQAEAAPTVSPEEGAPDWNAPDCGAPEWAEPEWAGPGWSDPVAPLPPAAG